MENSFSPSFGSSAQVFPFIEYRGRGAGMEKPSALIVEDDRDIGALFRHVLDLAGYRTEIVLHGLVAMEHLAKTTPDIVLLDLNLPGVSGCLLYTSPSP